ncbi:MAG: hypothetical protein AAB451_01135 [Patescibacteria group bacterium]
MGDILFFKEYQFTDTGQIKAHFALVLLPETATKYSGSVLCCVITSKIPKGWGLLLSKAAYKFFDCDSYACFNRKDLVSKSGLDESPQPKGTLNRTDRDRGFKILKKSLYVVNDLASDPYFRGIIIYHWKKALGLK